MTVTNESADQPLSAAAIAKLANSKPQGKQPSYFSDPMAEQNFSMTMSLMAELAVARERIDTLERVLVQKGVLDAEEVEHYVPDADAAAERQDAQVAYSARIFHALAQQLEALEDKNALSMDEMAEKLARTGPAATEND